MESALTVMAIFTFSTLVVRISSTIMRLTGLTDNVARFQCLSALTGTGFTTREFELIVNYPIRRRVLMTLMILGNLGLISISATFIVAFAAVEPSSSQILQQAAWFAGGLLVNFLILVHPAVDHFLCSTISRILSATTSLGDRQFVRLLSLEDNMTIGEHQVRLGRSIKVRALFPETVDLSLLMIRGEEVRHKAHIAADDIVSPLETVVCFGSEEMHARFSKWLREHQVAPAGTM